MPDALPFEQFISALRAIGVELPNNVDPNMSLEAAGLDSLARMSLIASVEQLGAEVPAHMHPLMETFAEVYHAYASSLPRT